MAKKKKTKPAVNQRQQNFCRYLFENGGNRTDAYRKAYPDATPKAAPAAATRLLKNVKVADYFQRLCAKHDEKYSEKTAKDIIEGLEDIAFSNIRDFMHWNEDGELTIVPSNQLSDRQSSVIQSIKSKRHYDPKGRITSSTLDLKLYPRDSALKNLGDNKGIFPTRTINTLDEGDPFHTLEFVVGPEPDKPKDKGE